MVRRGVYELSFSANEAVPFSVSIKTGTPKLYTILTAGAAPAPEKLYAFGAGIGRKVGMGKRLVVSPELTTRQAYLGEWTDGPNLVNRADLLLSWRVAKGVQLQAGPSFSVYYSRQKAGVAGYRFEVPGYRTIEISETVRGWGWWGWRFFEWQEYFLSKQSP